MTPLTFLILISLGLLALFVFSLYRIARGILSEGQIYLSELLLATLFVGMATTIARTWIYASKAFAGQEGYVVVLFMFFFMLSVLATLAYALHAMKKKEISGRRSRIILLIIVWSVACFPWFLILSAVADPV